jgi:uncharacterized protein (DUF2141 family)
MFKRVFSLAAVSIFAAVPAFAADLTVTLTDVQANGAPLYVGVQTEEQFMQWDGIASDKIEAPEAGTHTFTFDLPEGEYSVSVWHDLNSNGEFDLDQNQMPDEGYAMSNQAALRGMPTFDVVKVSVGPDGAAITERVNYPQ